MNWALMEKLWYPEVHHGYHTQLNKEVGYYIHVGKEAGLFIAWVVSLAFNT